MGFYRNTNTTKVVRAAAIANEVWDLYKKAKAESITIEKTIFPVSSFIQKLK